MSERECVTTGENYKVRTILNERDKSERQRDK